MCCHVVWSGLSLMVCSALVSLYHWGCLCFTAGLIDAVLWVVSVSVPVLLLLSLLSVWGYPSQGGRWSVCCWVGCLCCFGRLAGVMALNVGVCGAAA